MGTTIVIVNVTVVVSPAEVLTMVVVNVVNELNEDGLPCTFDGVGKDTVNLPEFKELELIETDGEEGNVGLKFSLPDELDSSVTDV